MILCSSSQVPFHLYSIPLIKIRINYKIAKGRDSSIEKITFTLFRAGWGVVQK